MQLVDAAGGALRQTVPIAGDQGVGASPDFIEVYEAHYGRLVRALELGGLGRASAEDVAQEAFARTLYHWRRVREGTNPPGYAYRVAFRLARRTFARETAHSQPLEGDLTAPGDVAGEATARTSVEAALDAMPPRRRACAVLCFMGGVSTKDAARSLGIAQGTVRKQLEHARATLHTALGDSGA